MFVDEVPGLGFALGAQPADIVTLTVDTLTGSNSPRSSHWRACSPS